MLIIKDIYRSVIVVGALLVFLSPARGYSQHSHSSPHPSQIEDRWVDSVYNALTPQERIGQLFMIRAKSTGDSAEYRAIADYIRQYNLGGICFFQGGPVRQAMLTNYYQSLAKTPIFISMDAEWGLGMRLDSTISFARAMTLGAIADTTLITECGFMIGEHLKRLGVHIDFAPVLDVNINPANPIINIRSFGEEVDDVIIKARCFNRGLSRSVLTVAKHFPGHGDTDTDSHYTLPVLQHSLETLENTDIKPFSALMHEVAGIMIGHLYVPALDSSSGLPASLSAIIIDSLLRHKMNFAGLVFTDALDMKGVANYAGPGTAEIKALLAGNDILLLPQSVPQAVDAILKAIENGTIPENLIEDKCRKVLLAKYGFGLTDNKNVFVEVEHLAEDLNSPLAESLNHKLYENSVTLLKNEREIIPILHPNVVRIACLTIGDDVPGAFEQRLDSYASIDHFFVRRDFSIEKSDSIFTQLNPYQLVIIAVRNTHPSPSRGFGISNAAVSLVDTLIRLKPVILDVFSLPYSLKRFKNIDLAKAVLISYQDNPAAHDISAQVIFGAAAAKGSTPVTVSGLYPLHSGLWSNKGLRISYKLPEEMGISSEKLAVVDSIVAEGLQAQAYPGCQVLVAKSGSVIYRKSFGYHDYSNMHKVLDTDLYDLASITKVAATTVSVMRLYDQGLIDINKPLSKYLPALQHTNKHSILIRDILAHQAKLKDWIPFFRLTLKNGKPDPSYYRNVQSDSFSIKVADSMFLRTDYPPIILDSVIRSPLLQKKEYKYSDLGFILLGRAVEAITGQPLDEYVKYNFYHPLGIRLCYNPLENNRLEGIVPTENDILFRQQLIHGYVHDQAAAMLGGISGHAGLFGNANDLVVLFQMLLQNGVYAGRTYIDSATVKLFTSQQFQGNRRGLGFDKPQLDRNTDGPACKDASEKSFGHTGFTGTYVWADPDKELIIVFLSNRVNPDAENNKLTQMSIRTRIQQAVYDAINSPFSN